MNWTTDKPTVNSFYGYRVEGQPDTIVRVMGCPPPGTASTDPVFADFYDEERPTDVNDLPGEFCGPIVLPE